MTYANRGKAAEAAVKKYLKSIESATCCHYRYPDMRSGFKSPAPCDYMVLRESKLTLIEVKSVEHGYRLPTKNFSPDQVARMRMWQAAGAAAWAVIKFDVPSKACWLAVPVDHFVSREAASWVFDPTVYRTLDEALGRILA